MIRIFGVTLILTSSVLTGIILAKDLNERVALLKDIRQAAIYIKSDFEYRAPILSECFENRGILFGKAAVYAKENNVLPKDALKKTVDEIKFLCSEDKDAIYSFADNLSQEEIGGQIANITWLIDTLEKRIKDAETEYKTKGRLYKSGGALTGIGLVILLL
ncbi:MAG: stage III sporulation protein AB [Clostridia bacterium]|nr:stage III sporulation protein AB [Clostridia bacterium]